MGSGVKVQRLAAIRLRQALEEGHYVSYLELRSGRDGRGPLLADRVRLPFSRRALNGPMDSLLTSEVARLKLIATGYGKTVVAILGKQSRYSARGA